MDGHWFLVLASVPGCSQTRRTRKRVLIVPRETESGWSRTRGEERRGRQTAMVIVYRRARRVRGQDGFHADSFGSANIYERLSISARRTPQVSIKRIARDLSEIYMLIRHSQFTLSRKL